MVNILKKKMKINTEKSVQLITFRKKWQQNGNHCILMNGQTSCNNISTNSILQNKVMSLISNKIYNAFYLFS